MMAGGAALFVDGTGGAASALCAPYAPRLLTAPAPDTCSYLLRPDACLAWASRDGSLDGLPSALQRWFGAPPTHSVAA
jgi:bifunctional hydroxylase/dehydrase